MPMTPEINPIPKPKILPRKGKTLANTETGPSTMAKPPISRMMPTMRITQAMMALPLAASPNMASAATAPVLASSSSSPLWVL